MSNISNPKEEIKQNIISNIRIIKFIAIILGVLIIFGLTALIIGLAKEYNNVNVKAEKIDNSFNQETVKMTSFTFFQPLEAQLISASLGKNNEILLRYQYQSKNVLIILDKSTKQKKAIITIKNKIDAWN
jgi:magnesium-transporting ATPase (P-type)